jgi:hypothetical protein
MIKIIARNLTIRGLSPLIRSIHEARCAQHCDQDRSPSRPHPASAGFSPAFSLVRSDTHRRCRLHCKPTWQEATDPYGIPKAVPAGAALEDRSTGSPSRPSSHCLRQSSPLASPRRRPSIPDGRRVPRTLGAPSARLRVRLITWSAMHGQTVSRAAPETLAGIKRAHRCRSRTNTDLVLDRLRSALLTIVDMLPRITRRAVLLVDLAAARARPPGSKHVKLCATLRRRRVFFAQGQDRSGRAP